MVDLKAMCVAYVAMEESRRVAQSAEEGRSEKYQEFKAAEDDFKAAAQAVVLRVLGEYAELSRRLGSSDA